MPLAMDWRRSLYMTLVLLGEPEAERAASRLEPHVKELGQATSREARARALAREATAVLMDLQALGFSLGSVS